MISGVIRVKPVEWTIYIHDTKTLRQFSDLAQMHRLLTKDPINPFHTVTLRRNGNLIFTGVWVQGCGTR